MRHVPNAGRSWRPEKEPGAPLEHLKHLKHLERARQKAIVGILRNRPASIAVKMAQRTLDPMDKTGSAN
jgi:hypothetical protein